LNLVRDGAVVLERRIHASPATVFSFFSSAEQWVLWQGQEATIEPWRGGVFRTVVPGNHVASGRFVEILPERRLVLTWGWEDPDHPVPPGSSKVEIDFLADGDGTLLRLRHTLLPASFIERYQAGWQHYTRRLLIRAEGGDPGPDEPFLNDVTESNG